mgnify:CR=1 FL=1
MRFDVSSTALLSRLQSISKVIASKNSLPILDSFLFNLEGNTLTVTASDAETRLVTSVDVMNAQGAGLFAVSAKILLDPLKELPEQPLTFDINDENLEIFIHFQNGKYNFIGQKGDTYPQQKPLNDNAISISMDAQMLLNGISRSLFATADDELRPVMNGVYFDIHTDDLTFVASDGHKLVRLRNLAVKSPERASFILPKKPANLLKNLLAKESEQVLIKFDDNNAYITCTNFEMVCRLIEGRYPNYNSVIPQENPFKVTIDRISFLNALKRVSVFSNPAPAVQAQQVNRLYHTEAGHPRQVEGIKDQEKPIRCQRKGQRGAHHAPVLRSGPVQGRQEAQSHRPVFQQEGPAAPRPEQIQRQKSEIKRRFRPEEASDLYAPRQIPSPLPYEKHYTTAGRA